MYQLTDMVNEVIFYPNGRSRGGTIIRPHYAELWAQYQAWLAKGKTPDLADPIIVPAPEDTPLIPEDIERVLLDIPGVTRAKIDAAKRDRGKPLP